MKDLKPGMMLEGVVTNVTAFGAFVDVGVHQDGLVHISALADRFVDNPHTVVKPGQIVKVRVLEVDLPRKRIALSMKSRDDREAGSGQREPRSRQPTVKPGMSKTPQQGAQAQSAMELAFAKLKR
jgi:uncharacterized protein